LVIAWWSDCTVSTFFSFALCTYFAEQSIEARPPQGARLDIAIVGEKCRRLQTVGRANDLTIEETKGIIQPMGGTDGAPQQQSLGFDSTLIH
jgi:hypothetical protein